MLTNKNFAESKFVEKLNQKLELKQSLKAFVVQIQKNCNNKPTFKVQNYFTLKIQVAAKLIFIYFEKNFFS